MSDPYEIGTCHDCGCKEGEFHTPGCDMERCPFCGGQLISCNCCYHKLGYKYDESKEFCGLPEEVYMTGLPDEDEEKWEEILEKKGKIPYIQWPNICAYCGARWPELFSVPDGMWKKFIQISKRNELVCKKCWDFIVKLQSKGAKQ